jgi:hypothetical protein
MMASSWWSATLNGSVCRWAWVASDAAVTVLHGGLADEVDVLAGLRIFFLIHEFQ